jgi:hypothetical protein
MYRVRRLERKTVEKSGQKKGHPNLLLGCPK